MKTILTDEQKQHLEKRHRSQRDGKVRDRIKAVLLHSEGWTQESIAQALRIHETTVWEHLKEYHNSEKLKSVSGGSLSKLSELDAKELETHLENNTYATTKKILEYVKETYIITYTLQGMHAWLRRHKFSYKKPKGVPAKFNAEKQEAFIEKYMELKSSLGNDDIILFMDSVHPTQGTKIVSCCSII